jgi:hypothetical protein
LLDISEKLKPELAEIIEQYGLSMEQFVVEGISNVENSISEKVEEAMAERAVQILEGYDKRQEMSYNVAMAQAQNQGTGGQMAQIMTGVSAGAAIAPAIGNMVGNVMQSSNGNIKGETSSRDQFSMGIVGKRKLENNSTKTKCLNCGAEIDLTSRFCNFCGTPVNCRNEERIISCPACGAKLASDSKFCNHCGMKL